MIGLRPGGKMSGAATGTVVAVAAPGGWCGGQLLGRSTWSISMNPDNFLDHAREIADLAAQVQVAIAGSGATPEVAQLTKTRVLDQDPVSAAETIDRDHSARGDERRRS